MSLTQLFKTSLVTIASCIAGYLSFVFFGGYLVFGFRNFAEFCLIAVPILILPAALLGYRYPAASAASSALIMLLFFGIQLYKLGPPMTRILHNGTEFSKFLSVTVLLTIAAALNHLHGNITLPATKN